MLSLIAEGRSNAGIAHHLVVMVAAGVGHARRPGPGELHLRVQLVLAPQFRHVVRGDVHAFGALMNRAISRLDQCDKPRGIR